MTTRLINYMSRCLILAAFTLTNTASADVVRYTVRKGEILSNILYYKLGCSPVYGPNGLIKKVLKENPRLMEKDGNHVRPGQVLVIRNNCGKTIAEETVQAEKSSEVMVQSDKPAQRIVQSENKAPEVIKTEAPLQREIKPVIEEEAVETKIWYSYFKLAPQVSLLTIDGVYKDQYRNSKLSSESATNPGINAEFGYYNSDGLGIFLETGFSQVNFYSDPDIDVLNLHPVRQSYAIGARYMTDAKTQVIMKVGFSDKLFLNAPDVSTVKIEKVQLPEVSLGIKREVLRIERFAVEAGLSGKAILPRKAGVIDGNLGFGTEAELTLKIRNKGLRFFYSYSDQRSSINDTTVSEMGLSLIFSMSFLDQ